MSTRAEIARFDLKQLRSLSKQLRSRANSVTRSIKTLKDSPARIQELQLRRRILLDAAGELEDMADEKEKALS